MRNFIPLLLTLLACQCGAFATDALLPPPRLDLRLQEKPPQLSTWAFAQGTARVDIETKDTLELITRQFQVDGKTAISLSAPLPLSPLISGLNQLEVPMPAKAQRGHILCKIFTVTDAQPDGKLLANLLVNILPPDAWVSLSKQAESGQVFIDPSLTDFKSWATDNGIPSLAVPPANPFLYHFGKPSPPPESPPPARFIIFERDTPDPLPVIEVINSPTLTKIILPPGFLQQLPHSAPSQALLLKHLNLLP